MRYPTDPRTEGSLISDVTLRARVGDEWVGVRTHALFAGRNIVVFSLPGASRRPARRRTCRATTSWRGSSARPASIASCASQ